MTNRTDNIPHFGAKAAFKKKKIGIYVLSKAENT